ncbi:neurobeachin/beige protein [Trypanosoma grayi]|uniref:neurobeachin/beige protein n=1 Tax=Trypanosoma grayi TaxID=71804 RepID=UPI0004F45BEC|nr:neurobeachin/beige protein [Trypanosoma grayi]KEG12141.1 neurobeachin/beige protein [Trypanosoma grayi]
MLKFFFVGRKVTSSVPDNDAVRRDQREEMEFASFLAAPAAAGIRAELDSHRSVAAEVHHPSPVDTGLEGVVLQFLQTESSPVDVPVKLLVLLIQRLGRGCANYDEADLVPFLRVSLPNLLALANASPSKSGVAMVELGLDEHLLIVLQFVRSRLMSRTTMWDAAAARGIATSGAAVASENTEEGTFNTDTSKSSVGAVRHSYAVLRREVMTILHNVLRLLVALHVGAMPIANNATGLPNSQLAKGQVRYRSENNSIASLVTLPHRNSSIESPSSTGVISVSGDVDRSVVRESIVAECGHLFLYCSKGVLDLNMPGEEEEQMVAEVLCSLALLIPSLYQDPSEHIVHVSLAGTGVQLARFLVVKEQKESDVLLRQLSCSLLLVTKLLRECPLLTIQAMGSVYFIDNLVEALQVMGTRYECALNDKGYAIMRSECMQELQSITDIEVFRVRRMSDKVLVLPRPRFDRLADNSSADEFLHCYLGLLETQRHIKTMAEVRSNSAVLRQFIEIELSILKSILNAPELLAPVSCIYDTLMKYVIYSLPLNDVGAPEKQRISVLKPLLNAGLYRMLFHERALKAFREDPRLQYAAVYLLHYMLTRPPSTWERDTMSSVEDEVGVILDTLLTGEAGDTLHDKPNVLVPLCAVLLSSVYGPNSASVVDAILQSNGIALFATIANKFSITDGIENRAGNIGGWVTYLLTQLMRQPEIQCGVLKDQAGIALSLLPVRDIRRDAEQMLTALLTHRCADTEYPQRMELLVKFTWESLSHCAKLDGEISETTVPIDAEDEDHIFLSILQCIRASIRALRADSPSWGPVRQLQNVLCGSASSTPDAFLRLLHRANLPWSGVKASLGLSSILHTISLLLQGNPALRAHLFETVSAEQLVDCFRSAWFASRGGSWRNFVYCILSLVYEEDSGSPEDGPYVRGTQSTPNSPVSHAGEKNYTIMQNPEILVPLLRIFTTVTEFKTKHRDALEYLLARISHTLKDSRVSLWMVANVGLFESLTALIPVVTGTALLEMVLALMMNIATHHINVRETKQFLISIVHTNSEEERCRFVPIVIEVLNVASYAFFNRQTERQNYIAFREYSGLTGVKAMLPDFPADGYSVCMWLRLERRVDRRMSQCIFSLQGVEKRTVLEVVATADGVFVIFQDAQKKTLELGLSFSLTPQSWTHLAVVHRQAIFPFTKSEFVLFINGAEVTTVSQVQYPQLLRGFFFIGTRGEDVEQRTSGGSFTGQMTAVYFFSRALSAKDVMELFVGETDVLNVKSYASHVAVCVDPRFGERGQLRNLATLPRGKPSERPLITYEGTVACNTSSIIDSICVLGALQTVVVPLLVLLVNPQLPFQCRVPAAKRKTVPEATRKALDDLLKLVESLLLSNIVRADVLEVGLFPMISHVLQQFVAYHCPNLPQRLCNLCTALLPDGAVFDAAYTVLFLSGDLLHACAEPTQLMLIKTQYIVCGTNTTLRQRVSGLDLLSFIAGEVAHVYNTETTHHYAMRTEFFSLMETIMVGPVTLNDAEAILRLVKSVVEDKREETSLVIEILERTRLLVVNRNPLLAVFMGKKEFAAVLIPLLDDARAALRNEALLFFCLLVSRSRRTQELLNPALLTSHEAVHVMYDVSLSWLRDKLQAADVDVGLYETLRAALTGRFDVSLKGCVEMGGSDKIVFAPALTPLLQLMKRCQNKAMKTKAMQDIASLVEHDPSSWKAIVSVPGWYASIVDLYLSEDESRNEQSNEGSALFAATTVIFTRSVFLALRQETYGASELELLVAYLVQQRAHVLLNAVLIRVVKEYIELLTARRDGNGGTNFVLGGQLASSNFTALLFVIEDVLFYSATTYQAYGVVRHPEPQRKRGYTEADELVVTAVGQNAQQKQEQSQSLSLFQEPCEMPDRTSFRSGDLMWIHNAPDGVWLHASLAARTMDLITVHSTILNWGGTSSNSSSSGNGGMDVCPRGRRLRKGGCMRLFVRLFRLLCSFTLRNEAQVDDILFLAARWVQLVENEQGSFMLLRRQLTEQKEHSPLSSSMIMILSLHELLTRRLRFSVQGPSLRLQDANHEILDRIKCLCILHRKAFNQMQVFHTEAPSDGYALVTLKGTLDWLCYRGRVSSMSDFVEVASRQDYDAFIFKCTLTMERDQLTEKSMVQHIEQEHAMTMAQLHEIITNLSVVRKTMLDALEEYLQATTEQRDEVVASTERYTPQAAHTLATVVFNTVWTRFLDRCKGTIWDLDPAGQHSIKYVRLREVEQQLLVRRKLLFDFNGTDHANITAMGSLPPDTQPPGTQSLSLRGGEQLLLSSDEARNEDEEDGEEGRKGEESVEDIASISALPSTQEINPTVHFSMACEVPYMMHCWSATLMIREGDLCIFFDDENTSYNQRIAENVDSFLIKPRSIIYPSGHTSILAPGRRFRMQRSALELWFRDGRSVMINFATIADMRIAVSNIRTAAERHKVPYMPFYVFNENPKKEQLLRRRTEQWRGREISNFDYLLWLNFFGGRTLNDLTQYPVFPWVLSDYTSERLDLENSSTFRDLTLPVGICGDPRCRARVELRYEETKQLGDVPAHYFTHYSSPAVALYYMVRLEPFTTLQIVLQGGRFDHADRMFHSMATCWHGVTTNLQDVRELIPELFYLPELCINKNGVQFGCRQEGEPMDALELPPWAHGDPYEFIYCMRESLECDYVSSMLHHWIDLIFGYKQRGKEAIAALNVFNWHSYEELDKNHSSDVDQKLLIDSLDNIGQTPTQLFTRSHAERRPQEVADPVVCLLKAMTVDIHRTCARVARIVVLGSDRVRVVGGSGATMLFRLVVTPVTKRALEASTVPPPGMPGTVPGAIATTTTPTSLSGRLGNSGVGGGIAPGRPSVDVIEEVERRTAPLPSGVVPSTSGKGGGPCETENIALLCLDNEMFVAFGGLFDNTFMVCPLDSSSVWRGERLSAHRGRIVCIAASADSEYLVSGAEDTTFIVWSCHLKHGHSKIHVDLLFTVYGHEDNPTAVDINPTLDLVATASRDGVLMLHSVTSSRLERSLRHPDKYPIDRVLIQSSCFLPNILYTSMTDHVIHQISINGVAMHSLAVPGRITSWCITPKQYILVTTAPYTKYNASEECGGTALFIHSFYLSILKTVACPLLNAGSTLSCCAVHPWNPQVILCGSSEGSLLLLRAE